MSLLSRYRCSADAGRDVQWVLHVFFSQAPGGHELHGDYWELVGLAPAGGADNLLNEESDVDVQLNNRHMLIRGENVSKILRVRSTVTQCFRDHFFSCGYYEVKHRFIVDAKMWWGWVCFVFASSPLTRKETPKPDDLTFSQWHSVPLSQVESSFAN